MERSVKGAIIKRLYVRVGRRRGWGSSHGRYKVDARETVNDAALEIGGKPIPTIHFAFDINIPDSLFAERQMPVVEVAVNADGTFADVPVVVQVPVDAPLEAQQESIADGHSRRLDEAGAPLE